MGVCLETADFDHMNGVYREIFEGLRARGAGMRGFWGNSVGMKWGSLLEGPLKGQSKGCLSMKSFEFSSMRFCCKFR